jgi:hypothetical protein
LLPFIEHKEIRLIQVHGWTVRFISH